MIDGLFAPPVARRSFRRTCSSRRCRALAVVASPISARSLAASRRNSDVGAFMASTPSLFTRQQVGAANWNQCDGDHSGQIFCSAFPRSGGRPKRIASKGASDAALPLTRYARPRSTAASAARHATRAGARSIAVPANDRSAAGCCAVIALGGAPKASIRRAHKTDKKSEDNRG